ncbi:complement C3-like isoform X2 [Channa argus]|uniref:complement C3-like isoform X2 n=1 Tax=Channa argus TaxID=215402 RepID=UPI003520F36A
MEHKMGCREREVSGYKEVAAEQETLTAAMSSDWTLLWQLAFLAHFFVTSLGDGAPLKVMSAPNLLRVGTVENIFVECQDCSESEECNVDITVLSHPTKARILASTTVTLTKTNNFQDLAQIKISEKFSKEDSNMKHYVYLQARFPDVELEKVVLLSFQSGYIFIQTDKTIYTPNSDVLYRMFAVRPNMEPVDSDDKINTDTFIITEIVTPDGIILPLDQSSLRSGIHSGSYKLGEIVSTGLWKITARFNSKLEQSFSAEFEVKEYVLPSFEVKLTATKPFFLVDSEELTIYITAKYLFGKEVTGAAYAVFGVVSSSDKKSLPSSLQKVVIKGGNGEVTLKREHITETHQNISDLVGSSIYVTVSVLTESGGEMVEAELRSIQIVTSPYTISLKKTAKYFKIGIPFDVVIDVANPDGTPAKDIAVELIQVSGVTNANGMASLSINTVLTPVPMEIIVKTNVPGISQASATMTALPYITKSESYIHIGVDSDDVKLGDNLKINLHLNKDKNVQHNVTYLILSKGQLVKHGRYSPRKLISVMVTITKDMLPSFRIIAYYHTNDNEVVSDSVRVPVKCSCMGSLKLESSSPASSYEPGKNFPLKVTGDPEAAVGLVAVDKGVYVLNNKHRLTQKKIWDIVDMYDTGCTPGGGKDAMNVFYDAGLLFQSNVASGSPHRQEFKCPNPSRRKRASTLLEVKTSLVSQYKEKKQRDCCLSGMRDTPLSYNCERRSEYIMDGAACVEAFLHCCKQLENQRAEMKHDSLLLARSEEDDSSYMDSNEIVSRTKFPESWLWTIINLPACSTKTPNCATTFYKYQSAVLKDSITTWLFTGISLSRHQSICVADPLEVIVQKLFFIDLRLPYSAVRGEQLQIKAILHNYSPDDVTVRVDLIENQHVCSSASRRRRYRQEVEVGSGSTRSLPFIIIPMKEGEVEVEVKAAVKDSSFLHDGIMKKLLVVPEGIHTKSLKNITLDPVNKGVGGKQEEILSSKIPNKDIVPNTPAATRIYVTGREQLSALVENAISGKSMGSLIQQPSGCGEQNMIAMTLPVIATTYLDKTNQWETVGFEKRNEALVHIKTGYRNELVYRKQDGGFAVFKEEPHPSTWLTAYVAKVFAMAYDLVGVEEDIICEAVKFLIGKQESSGTFKEAGRIIHGEMIGDVRGKDSDASMTAFCLSAMQESRRICNRTVKGLSRSIDEAVTYLEKRLHNLTNPYAAAISSYVLANEGKLQRQILSKFISPELTHWPVGDTHLFTLEATAYGLLALVKVKAFDDARPVVRWFNQQQIDGGGYGSTQATIMVYQAIAEYWVSANEEEYDVNVDIVFSERKNPVKFNFNRDDHYTTKTSEVKSINKNVKVIATGTGEATVKMVSLYYALPKEKESNCQKFNLSVELIPVKMDLDEKIYKLKILVFYKDNARDATMTILDIGLLTGFTVNTDDLNSLSKGCARTISRYEMDKTLSDRGSLIIYLIKVSHRQPEEITFRIHQTLKVGVLQPAAVTVYEYYDHQQNNETHCVKFYHPERREGELLRLCKSNECTCAEENCSMQKKEKINNEDRTDKACETEVNSRTDYVYKVRVENFTADLSTDIYTMRVERVIKEGSYDTCQMLIKEDATIENNCDIAPEGISMCSVKEPGLSTGQRKKSARLMITGIPVWGWRIWLTSSQFLDVC